MLSLSAGTSADMYRTVFELLVSVKLFLGRFDMRTMQVSPVNQNLVPSCCPIPYLHASALLITVQASSACPCLAATGTACRADSMQCKGDRKIDR